MFSPTIQNLVKPLSFIKKAKQYLIYTLLIIVSASPVYATPMLTQPDSLAKRFLMKALKSNVLATAAHDEFHQRKIQCKNGVFQVSLVFNDFLQNLFHHEKSSATLDTNEISIIKTTK